jgi:hypothetical protein
MIEIIVGPDGVPVIVITASTDPRVCDCGAWRGDCDCDELIAQAAAAPVLHCMPNAAGGAE